MEAMKQQRRLLFEVEKRWKRMTMRREIQPKLWLPPLPGLRFQVTTLRKFKEHETVALSEEVSAKTLHDVE
ncbi:unnamed protein product [Prunus armeniaca]